MNKKFGVIFLTILALLVISACERPASKAPFSTATSTGVLPFPLPANESTQIAAVVNTQSAPSDVPSDVPSDIPVVEASQTPVLVIPSPTLAPQPTPTFVVVATATPGLPTTYALHDGEWPYCIARRFNVDPSELLTANDLTMEDKPAAGTELKIPQGANPWPGPRALIEHPSVYTAAEGDTIYSIACDFGDVDPNGIIAANNLKSPYTVTAGQVLQIP
ncbi:MAG: LysM peptidoglycan-binding domain-containing protein [Chloroflexi bacterium]|nr:LysM peptidoglycan-binding domain-containing protein [Chloroflexota bacterium]